KLTLNKWIAGALTQAALRATEALEAFEFNAAADTLYHFTWGTYCDWYVEFSKPLLTGTDVAAKAETRAMTAWVLSRLVHLLHPIMPFVTEELWKHLADGKGGLLIQSQWPALDAELVDHDAAAEMDWVVALIAQIRTARAEMNVPPAQEIAAYVTEAGGDEKDWLARHDALIRRLARLKRIHPVDATAPAKQNTIQVVVEGASLLLDFAGAIDVGKERARLQKEAQSIRIELDKIAAKLGNEQFLSKAKTEAIDEQRERQAEARAALTRLDAALARIGGA
ncbi:MAG: class I tRNA ligase family protein, partial [Alphaproteobacteria bacterium]|nr:class I tRNA ligase family protein [Alphaproteobacteria bacterium]